MQFNSSRLFVIVSQLSSSDIIYKRYMYEDERICKTNYSRMRSMLRFTFCWFLLLIISLVFLFFSVFLSGQSKCMKSREIGQQEKTGNA